MTIPTLTTSRLTLRAIRAGDWDAFAAMNADPIGRKFLGGNTLTRAETWTQMENYLGQWALRGYGHFAVEAAGGFAGRIGIWHPVDWPEPELGWTLARPFWGQGLATEAAACVRDWAFSQFGWDHLVSYIDPENARSRRVADRLGAVRQGPVTLRSFVVDVWRHPAPGSGIVV